MTAWLENSPLGSMTGTWQSYINIIAEPEAGTGTEPELQATAERGSAGEFQNLGGGKYSYRFGISLTDLPQDILDQAATQGLVASYGPR